MVTLFVIITDNRVSVDVCCYCSLMYPLTSAVGGRCQQWNSDVIFLKGE